mmetsp:Transcript_19028/g.76438  ORF Transcript_19028/g.76438 Transcript_19028/m.76438 type:complete len:137 (+) Transcript_19028:3048-3458(+)
MTSSKQHTLVSGSNSNVREQIRLIPPCSYDNSRTSLRYVFETRKLVNDDDNRLFKDVTLKMNQAFLQLDFALLQQPKEKWSISKEALDKHENGSRLYLPLRQRMRGFPSNHVLRLVEGLASHNPVQVTHLTGRSSG